MSGERNDHRDIMIVLAAITDESGYVKGNPYREIALYSDTPLSLVAQVLLDAFGFDSGKAFGFYSTVHGDYSRSEWHVDSLSPSIMKIPLAVIDDMDESQMLFVYDFEDEWRFLVKYINRMESSEEIVCPAILTRQGSAPDQYGPDTWDNPVEEVQNEHPVTDHGRFFIQKTLFDRWD